MTEQKKEYYDNPFSLNLMKLQSKATKDLMKKPGFKLGQNNYHLLNPVEKYVSDTGKINMELRNVFEQLHHIKIFLRRFPQRNFYKENGITKTKYIQYHTESLYHKIQTLLEIMKLLVNQVYKLKISKKKCDWYHLTKKLDKNTPSLEVIDLFYRAFQNFIESRHLNSHRGIYFDEEVDELEKLYGLGVYELSESMNYELDEDFKKNFPPILLEYRIKELRKKRIKLVESVEENANTILHLFLTSLNSEFESHTKTLYNIGYSK